MSVAQQGDPLPPFFIKKQQTKAGVWITVTYCNLCKHRVGSRKIHKNLHDLNIDLDSHHNVIIGKYWEVFDGLTHIVFNWTDLHEQGSVVHGELKIDWQNLTAMTAIDREIRNILRPSTADLEREEETREYYGATDAHT